MYNSAVDLAKGTKDSVEVVFNLATVKSVSGDGRANVQFYGDSAVSGKTYPYIEGYKPTVNDDVLMIKQGSTYIIAGKISKSAVGDSYYISKAALDAAAYLTQAVADTLYMPINTTIAALKTGNHTFTLSTDNSTRYLLPSGNKTFDIGSSSYMMRRIYAEQAITTRFGGAWTSDPTSTSSSTYNLSWDSASQILPSWNNGVSIGSSSKQLNNVYAKQFWQNVTAISKCDKRMNKTIPPTLGPSGMDMAFAQISIFHDDISVTYIVPANDASLDVIDAAFGDRAPYDGSAFRLEPGISRRKELVPAITNVLESYPKE